MQPRNPYTRYVQHNTPFARYEWKEQKAVMVNIIIQTSILSIKLYYILTRGYYRVVKNSRRWLMIINNRNITDIRKDMLSTEHVLNCKGSHVCDHLEFEIHGSSTIKCQILIHLFGICSILIFAQGCQYYIGISMSYTKCVRFKLPTVSSFDSSL